MSPRLFEDGIRPVLRSDAAIDGVEQRLSFDEALSASMGRVFSSHFQGHFGVSLRSLIEAADQALKEAKRRDACELLAGEMPDPDFEIAAEEFAAMVALAAADQASIANGQGGIVENARLVRAAYRAGILAAQRDFIHRGLLAEAAVKQVNHEQRTANARKGAAERRRELAPRYDQAYAEFKARKNEKQSPHAWSECNARRYGVQANHLARELRARVHLSGRDPK